MPKVMFVMLLLVGWSPVAYCQVRSSMRMQRIPASRVAALTGSDVEILMAPARVLLADQRVDEGWFLIVADPVQKLYWWRFQTGSPDAAPESAAVEFGRSCKAVKATGELAVFCATDRRIMASVSKRKYTDDNGLADAVKAEFDRRAAVLDEGFDYFDKVHNLYPALGPDFFVEAGRAQNAGRIRFESIKRVPTGWELVIAVRTDRTATLMLSPSLDLVTFKVFNK